MIYTFLKDRSCTISFTLMSNSKLTAMSSTPNQSTSSKTPESPINSVINWLLRFIPAIIVGRAAFMKFAGGENVVTMFETLEMEPGGRILIGIIEAICIAILLSPRISGWGAILCLGVMVGAVIAHVSVLGFSGALGVLFVMALISSVASIALIYRLRHQVPFVHDMFNE